ncbi:LPS assembly lipoprotein LptE [Helicobacter mustelae]|uniref:Putative outer membrane protein n=1 Tax=Helicobacter mustelae (strain ATCC 43772 / CCUG 25715 / CIP 103759 / LMG 18044 / NCTC 12198 / R85-136P) TaxID=679897 RepID=D3UID8_HELM1|nr:LPS assembly lipoprotein LptE [Helicobacter mustelae]CBG40261.1 putative outer membrane protein [Helicobacter mustelae 12198]SQH71760.1 putative lipoprotein [Helicobacter mustelae]
MNFFAIAFVLLSFFLSGCGYQPIAHYAKKALGDSIFVNLKMNLANPENSIEIKDMVNRAIIAKFQNRLASRDEASTTLTVELQNVTDTSIATNTDGFTTFYRVNIQIAFLYKNHLGKEGDFVNSAYFDYAVSLEDPLITYMNRLDAIRQASLQCIDRFLTQIAHEGK